jgi:hypothetical protein
LFGEPKNLPNFSLRDEAAAEPLRHIHHALSLNRVFPRVHYARILDPLRREVIDRQISAFSVGRVRVPAPGQTRNSAA